MCAAQTDNILDGLEEDEEERRQREKEIEEKGETWRAGPAFLEDECNLLDLGTLLASLVLKFRFI